MERGGPGATNWRDPSTGRFSGCWVCTNLATSKHRRCAPRFLPGREASAVVPVPPLVPGLPTDPEARAELGGMPVPAGPGFDEVLSLRHRRLHSPRHRAPPQVPNDLLQSVTYVLGLTVTYLPGRSQFTSQSLWSGPRLDRRYERPAPFLQHPGSRHEPAPEPTRAMSTQRETRQCYERGTDWEEWLGRPTGPRWHSTRCGWCQVLPIRPLEGQESLPPR